MSDNIYAQKSAVVTGVGSGLGRELMLSLAKKGAKIAGCDVNSAALEETAALVREAAPEADVLTYTVDVANSEAVRAMIYDVREKRGSVDFMFNIAGVALVKEERVISVEKWDWLMGIDLMGVIYGTHYAYEIMREQKSGHIVNMSSVNGLTPSLWGTAYAAAKFGITGFTLCLRIESQRHNVNVSAVCAAGIKTPMMELSDASEDDRAVYRQSMRNIRLYGADETSERILRALPKKRPIILIDWYTRALWAVYRIMGVRYYEHFLKQAYSRYYLAPLKRLQAKREEAQEPGKES
jgi:NAD(P)-dependent dehydrogenase (short-subunit alcohol dehydrogenase family)